MADVEVRVDMGTLRRAAEEAPRRLLRGVKTAFSRSLRHLEQRLVQERLSGDPLRRRTGQLARGWFVIVVGDTLGSLVGMLATNVPYAAIHEFGGTIRPKRGRWLWIPAAALQTPAGVFRGWDGVPWDTVFFRRSKRNPANLVALAVTKTYISGRITRRKGQRSVIRGSQEIMHVATLVAQVTIQGSLGLRDLARDDEPYRMALVNAAIRSALNSKE